MLLTPKKLLERQLQLRSAVKDQEEEELQEREAVMTLPVILVAKQRQRLRTATVKLAPLEPSTFIA